MEDPTFRLLSMAYSQERHVYSGVLGIPSEVVVDGEEAAHASPFPEERICNVHLEQHRDSGENGRVTGGFSVCR
jgi:hypothetical protein